MQTALHIYSLVRELNDRIIGTRLVSTTFYKKEREAYLHFKTGKGRLVLGLVYHPQAFGTFLVPEGKIEIDTPEKPWPFFQAALGGEVTVCKQYDLDRVFEIGITKDKAAFVIVVEAIGPNGNFWLLDDSGNIAATLRHRRFDRGERYRPLPAPDKPNPFTIDENILAELMHRSTLTPELTLRKSINGLDQLMGDHILASAGVAPGKESAQLDDGDIGRILDSMQNLTERFNDYSCGYMYYRDGSVAVYPFKLKTLAASGTRLKGLSLAVYKAIRAKRSERATRDDRQRTNEAVKRYIKRLRKKIDRITVDLETARDFEKYKKDAELIKINLPQIRKGDETMIVEDVYAADGSQVEIALDPALSPAANADEYFRKYRKGREALTLLQRRLEIAQKELASAETMVAELSDDFEAAAEKYRAEIAAILPKTAGPRETVRRLPFREYSLASGVRILVGREGADNDETTFHHAKPYELWFHASQCPGSHVVIKFPDKSFVPSAAEIHEAAAAAAYFSKARKSATVPVAYTQRKYVRKPRGAKPGLVTIEREKTVMVEPRKPDDK